MLQEKAIADQSPAAGGPADRPAWPGKRVRNLLKDRAYREIKHRILVGDFEPGSFLSERQIAGWLAMSPTPIRAALARLELEGLIAVSPQQGVLVRDLAVHEIADQFEIRLALETYVLGQLAGRLAPPQVDEIRANLHQQRTSIDEGDIPRNIELDTAFHLLFCRFLGNREIQSVMERLRDKVHRVIVRVYSAASARLLESYDEHCRIAEAVITGHADQATRSIADHLDRGKQVLLSPRQR